MDGGFLYRFEPIFVKGNCNAALWRIRYEVLRIINGHQKYTNLTRDLMRLKTLK